MNAETSCGAIGAMAATKVVCSRALDGGFAEEKMAINADVSVSGLVSDLYRTIFLGKHKLILKERGNYVPPEYPRGKN
jgi:hypothetical protein